MKYHDVGRRDAAGGLVRWWCDAGEVAIRYSSQHGGASMSDVVLGDAHAFVVRIWCETADEAGNTLTYRGVIQDVTTGRQMGFENLRMLASFICTEAQLTQPNPEDQVADDCDD